MRTFMILSVHVEHYLAHKDPFSNVKMLRTGLLPILKKKNISAAWYLQIEPRNHSANVLETCAEVVDNLSENGEIGVHTHWYPFCDREHKFEHIRYATETLEHGGYRPATFVAGKWLLDEETIAILEELGYLTDLSCVPGFSYRGHMSYMPFQPYHPSYDDHNKPGNAKLLIIPNTVDPKNFHTAHLESGSGQIIQIYDHIKAYATNLGLEDMVLVLPAHSWVFVDGNNLATLEKLLKIMGDRGVEFVTPSEISNRISTVDYYSWTRSNSNLKRLYFRIFDLFKKYRYVLSEKSQLFRKMYISEVRVSFGRTHRQRCGVNCNVNPESFCNRMMR